MTSYVSKIAFGSLFCATAIVLGGRIEPYTTEFYPTIKQHQRATIRHIEAGGIGYKHGYTTFETFLARAPELSQPMPFLDVRAHVFDNGKIAANIGLGLRKIDGCRVYGLNAYYDYRKAQRLHYNQIGFGFESLGKRFDFRINGYLPIGRQITNPFQSTFIGFSGHQMILKQNYNFAMKAAQAEVGWHVGMTRFFDLQVAAGAYYLKGKIGPKIWGGKGRLTCRFNDYVTLEFSNSYDKMFHNRFQCQLGFTLPFGRGSQEQTSTHNSCDRSDLLFSRMVQPVERQEIIIEGCTKKCTPAIDPSTCQPFNFVFVDNTSHSRGTFESPYPTLAQAQTNSKPGDIIYVFPGDGTTKGMDAGITLQNRQKFWGSGISHALQTAQGTFVIPALSSTAPTMTNTDGDGITLASKNQISGFTITNVFNNGIFGTNLDSVDIADCTINNSQFGDQIHLEFAGSLGRATMNRLNMVNGQQNGLFISSDASLTQCAMNNCVMTNTTVFTVDATFAHEAVFEYKNNLMQDNVNGSSINFDGPASLLVSGNIFTGTTSVSSRPLSIAAGPISLIADIENNTISDNVCGGILFVLNDTSSAQLSVLNNRIVDNGTGSAGPLGATLFLNPNGTNSGNCNLNLTNNIFASNAGSSLYCNQGSYNDFQVNATSNSITNNGGGGFVFASDCNSFALNATKNIITNGLDHGISTTGIINQADMRISQNQITGNTNLANGIALSHEGSNLNFIVTDNNLSSNDSSGIIMYSSNIIEQVAIDIENNNVANNQNLNSNAAGGVDLEQYTNLSGTFNNNTMSNNVGAGLYVASTDPSPSVCLSMSGNTSDTGYTLLNNSGTFNLAPCDVDTVNSGAITEIGIITAVQSCPNGLPCPP